ncbi:MAG: DUF4269 domain-containing protein [Gammaproteobacteria bacterium]|nr:DUF4269 domain-containing protein [Gammaproteobacteria bacterium]
MSLRSGLTLIRNRKQQAKAALEACHVMDLMDSFSATVVSTIWVGLDTDKSDIDLLFQYQDREDFIRDCKQYFSQHEQFIVKHKKDCVIVRFIFHDFLFELYASQIPVEKQPAHIHFQVMKRLSELGGEALRRSIVTLKHQGLKTEPAIAKLLNLSGDPYEQVMKLADCSDESLSELIAKNSQIDN